MTDERELDRLYEWQKSRRKPEGHFDVPVEGFGADGQLTLYVPSPKAFQKYVFEGGRPQIQVQSSCLDDPAVALLRDEVIRSFASEGPGVLSVDLCFLSYTAAILRLNYNLSDEDLTYALSGSKWHAAMVRHVCGADDFIAALQQIAPYIVQQHAPAAPAPRVETLIPDRPVPPRRNWLSRLLGR